MAHLIADPRLSLRALGTMGDPQIEDGIHLRWSFAPELGFPPGGFRLFIRAASAAKLEAAHVGPAAASVAGNPPPALAVGGVTVHSADGEPLEIGAPCEQVGLVLSERRLVIRFRDTLEAPRRLARAVTLLGMTRGGVRARALHAGRVTDCAATGSCTEPITGDCQRFVLTLNADAIDTVVVSGCAGVLMTVRHGDLAEDESERGWKPIASPFCLPVEHSPAYPCNPPDAEPRALAKSRLPDPAHHPPGAPDLDELVDRLLGPGFDELHEALLRMLTRAPVQPPHLQVEPLSSDDPGDATIYRLQALHHVLLGSVDPYFARIVGLYHVDRPTQGRFDYKVEADFAGAERPSLCWVTFGAAAEPQPPLAPPAGLSATAFAGTSRVSADGTIDRHQMDVGLRWERPSPCDLAEPSRSSLAWLVERTAAGAPASGPYERLSRRRFDEGGPLEETPLMLAESAHPGTAFPLGQYVDVAPGYGRFHYRLRGRDLFGRTSKPSDPAAIDVRDEVPPGSPVNLAADYVDPADPERAGSAALQWANRDAVPGAEPRPAVLVRWTWPLARQQQAPDADEFRLYFRRGLLNALTGTARAVTDLGAGRFRVATDLPAIGADFPDAPAPVDLGVLRNEGEDYRVLTLKTATAGLVLTVQAPPAAPPLPGRCALRIGAGEPGGAAAHPAWRSFREAADWPGLEVDPTIPGDPLAIGLDGSVRTPLPPGLTAADVDVSRTAETTAGGAHLHYELRLRGIVLATSRDAPRTAASFGVTAVDDAVPGNESRVSPPAGIFAIHRQPPDVPVLELPEEVFASPADWHGRSFFALTWPAERGVGYLVYRTSDVMLLEQAGVTLAAHRALSPGQQRQQLRQLGSRRAHVDAFSAVTPAPILASSDGPLSYRDQLDGNVSNRFIYRLRAIDAAGNFANWPPDPAPANAGRVATVVAIPPTTPPSQPRWAGTDPLAAGLALHWAPNPEPDLAGYRLYRAEDAAAAADTRSMTPLLTAATPEGTGGLVAVEVRRSAAAEPGIEIQPLPAGDTRPGRLIRFVDATVIGGRTTYYRLVAEDRHGHRSRPSEPLAVRAPKRTPPEPPAWVAAEDAAELAWSAGEPDLEVLVLRRGPGELLWRPLAAWLPRGTLTFADESAEPGIEYDYRLRVRDRVGQSVDGPVQTVTA